MSRRAIICAGIVLLTLCAASTGVASPPLGRIQRHQEQQIPILGVMIQADRPVGTVVMVTVSFAERTDASGLAVTFPGTAGKLSPMAQTSIEQAIYRTARMAGLSPDAWSVAVSVPQSDVTIYGSSLSAMVGLTVIAVAKGQSILPDRAVTGGIAPDGRIITVGGVPLKIEAARAANLKRVLVPEETSVGDDEWRTPFLMHISPVGSVHQAYLGLTGVPLISY